MREDAKSPAPWSRRESDPELHKIGRGAEWGVGLKPCVAQNANLRGAAESAA